MCTDHIQLYPDFIAEGWMEDGFPVRNTIMTIEFSWFRQGINQSRSCKSRNPEVKNRQPESEYEHSPKEDEERVTSQIHVHVPMAGEEKRVRMNISSPRSAVTIYFGVC